LQPSDTAYPRFKSRPSAAELERFYTPCENERLFCDSHTRSQATRLGFALLLKTQQGSPHQTEKTVRLFE
jgi:hypothetical protein